MSSSALNFDSTATVAGICYEPRSGCLDRAALNFNCSAAECSADVIRMAAMAMAGLPVGMVTLHEPALCSYPPPPPQGSHIYSPAEEDRGRCGLVMGRWRLVWTGVSECG